MVFPTCVGMNRFRLPQALATSSVPHVRGDEPLGLAPITHSSPRVPHVRGDEPVRCTTWPAMRGVFPTCVGMNRCRGRA